MTLKTVALITLIIISIGWVARVGMTFEYLLAQPATFVITSLESWALMFFFFMLYQRAEDPT